MLPSKGFFSCYSCPFYENSTCDRPYCHFHHRKKKTKCSVTDEQKAVKELQGSQMNPNKLFPKSEEVLINLDVEADNKEYSSAIYNTTNLLVYEPTPISELKKRNTSTEFKYFLGGIDDGVLIKKQKRQIPNKLEEINNSEYIYLTQNMSNIQQMGEKENKINQLIHFDGSKNVENSWNKDGSSYACVIPSLHGVLNNVSMAVDGNMSNSKKINNYLSETQTSTVVSGENSFKSTRTLLQDGLFPSEEGSQASSHTANEETYGNMDIANNQYHTILSPYPYSSATGKEFLGAGEEYFLNSILNGKKNEKYFGQDTDKSSFHVDFDSYSCSLQTGETSVNGDLFESESVLSDSKNKYSIPRETYANIVKHEKNYYFSNQNKSLYSSESRNKNPKQGQSFFGENSISNSSKSEMDYERSKLNSSEPDKKIVCSDKSVHQASQSINTDTYIPSCINEKLSSTKEEPQSTNIDRPTSTFNDSSIPSHINGKTCNTEEKPMTDNESIGRRISSVSKMNGSVKTRVAHSDSTVRREISLPIEHPKRLIHTSPSQVLLERWKTVNGLCRKNVKSDGNFQTNVKETIPKMRIAHVPNVAALLAERERITNSLCSSGHSVGSDLNGTTIHSETMSTFKPECLIESVINSKIPLIKRQKYLDKALEFYCQIYSYGTAKAKAVDTEREICSTSKTPTAYSNKFAQLFIRLKKEISTNYQNEESSAGSADISNTVKTNKEALYNDLMKYLMHDLEENGIPVSHPKKIGFARMKKIYGVSSYNKDKSICINCMKEFQVDAEGFSIERLCKFHPGKLLKQKKKYGTEKIWTCCSRDKVSGGCIENELHVRDMVDYDNIPGFKQTKDPKVSPGEYYQVFAMDCEMCYTTQGSELTRCTVVDSDLNVVYDKLCVPELPIIDYCTKFSGISKGDLDNISTKLLDVQSDLLRLFNSKTILIGHGIGNDLKAVKLLHKTIIDTSEVYGSYRKHKKLSELTKDILHREIQNNGNGHDSCEDAVAAMELMLVKVNEDKTAFKPRTIISLDSTKKKLWNNKN